MTSLFTAGRGGQGHILQNKQTCISSFLTCLCMSSCVTRFILVIKDLHSDSRVYLTMGKTKTEKKCYQSPSGSRPPKCRQSSASLCGSCFDAMAHYNQVGAIKQASRRQKNRESARLSRMKREDKYSDLLADNLALNMEYEELVRDLEDLNAAKDAECEAISAKVQEILAISFISGP